MTTHSPSSQAGLASLRRFTTSDGDGGGRVRCASCGAWYGLNESHSCPSSAFLAAALPSHPLVLTDDQTQAEMDDMSDLDAFFGGPRLIAHSTTIRTRHLTLVPGKAA